VGGWCGCGCRCESRASSKTGSGGGGGGGGGGGVERADRSSSQTDETPRQQAPFRSPFNPLQSTYQATAPPYDWLAAKVEADDGRTARESIGTLRSAADAPVGLGASVLLGVRGVCKDGRSVDRCASWCVGPTAGATTSTPHTHTFTSSGGGLRKKNGPSSLSIPRPPNRHEPVCVCVYPRQRSRGEMPGPKIHDDSQ
jgi:hypothetical protein